MSVYAEKRSGKLTGRHIAEVQVEGQRFKRAFTNKKDADKQERLWLRGVVEEAPVKPGTGPMTREQFAKEARVVWKGQKDELQSCRRLELCVPFLKKVMDKRGLADDIALIDKAVLEDFMDAMQGTKPTKRDTAGYKPGSVNRYLRNVTRALGWAADRKRCPQPPKITGVTEAAPEFFVLTEDNERDIQEHLKAKGQDDVILLMQVQLAAGTRIGELTGQRGVGKHKDPLDPKCITLVETRSNSTPPHALLELRDTKNGEVRFAPIPLDMGKALKALAERGMPTYIVVKKALLGARKALGLSLVQPTHAHRHTVATRMLMSGENDATVKEYMGHKSLNTTLRYTHFKTEHKVAAMFRQQERRKA